MNMEFIHKYLNLKKLNRREKYIVYGVGCLVGIVIIVQFIIRPFFENKNQLERTLHTRIAELQQMRELPGVEEKDIKVSLEGNQLTVSGEKKQESKRDEKDWHIEERSFGSFYRSMSLPFTPEGGAIEAHLDKGVLHVTVKKPAEVVKSAKTIEIKTGAPPQA